MVVPAQTSFTESYYKMLRYHQVVAIVVAALAIFVGADAAAYDCYNLEPPERQRSIIPLYYGDQYSRADPIPVALPEGVSAVYALDRDGARVAGRLEQPDDGDVALWWPDVSLEPGSYSLITDTAPDELGSWIYVGASAVPAPPSSQMDVVWESIVYRFEDSYVCCDTADIYKSKRWDCYFEHVADVTSRGEPVADFYSREGSYYTVDKIERGTIYYAQRCYATAAVGATRWTLKIRDAHPYVGYRVTAGDAPPLTTRRYGLPALTGLMIGDEEPRCVTVEQYDLRTGEALAGVAPIYSCAPFGPGHPEKQIEPSADVLASCVGGEPVEPMMPDEPGAPDTPAAPDEERPESFACACAALGAAAPAAPLAPLALALLCGVARRRRR